MQNQTYQSDYIPSVWYTKYRKPPGSHPTRTETTNEKLPSSDNGVSWVIVAGVLLVVTLTTAALAVAVFFSLRGNNDSRVTVSTTTPADETDVIEGYDLEIYNNPLDYRAFKAITENGTVTVYGQKDASGTLTLPELIEYVDEDGNKSTVTLDNNGLIQGISNDNVSIQFTWSPANNSLFAIALKTDGSLQANVNIQLENVTLPNIDTSSSPSSRKKRSFSDVLNIVKRQTANYARVPVSVNKCGSPEDGATVYGSAIFSYDENNPCTPVQVQGQSTGETGKYEILLPTEAASDAPEVIDNICSGISDVVGTGCTVVSAINAPAELQICTGIATAIEALTFALPGDFVLVLSACEIGFRATRVTCKAFDSPVSGPGPTLFDAACSAVEGAVDLALNQGQDVFLKPSARLSNGQVLTTEGQVIEVQPGDSSVSATFTLADDGLSFEVISLEAIPNDPAPMEDYNVEIYYNCVSQGSLSMSIVGTDSYMNDISCVVANDCFCCLLYVPGAAALVTDLVTVTYSDDTGQSVFTRQLVLVF